MIQKLVVEQLAGAYVWWIYEKEAILEYILHKKMENAKLLKQFEKQKLSLWGFARMF